MGDSIVVSHVQEYSSNLQLLLQQKKSRLRQAVMEGSHVGKNASPVDQLGAVEASDYDVRHPDTPNQDVPEDRRWVAPKGCHVGHMVDEEDLVKVLTDIKSGYAQVDAAAIARKVDRKILEAMFGTAKTGEDGTTSTTWAAFVAANATHQIAAGGVGLTIPKLRAAKQALETAEVDLDSDPIYCAIKAKQHAELLAEQQAISMDYNEKPVLTEGKITYFLGIHFIHTELVQTSGANNQVPVWAKSGMHLGVWKDAQGFAQLDPSKSFNWRVYARGIYGATRLEEKKLVECLVVA